MYLGFFNISGYESNSWNLGKFELSILLFMRYLCRFVPFFCFMVSMLFLSGCHNQTIKATDEQKIPAVKPFRLSSPNFTDGGFIPMLYTCDSLNFSPALCWNNPFNNTKSFALIAEDPDVPTQPWVHWIVYNIPASDTCLAAHFPMDSVLKNGIKQGFTSFCITGYAGPCPPDGMHRYYFKLFALDTILNVPPRLTKQQLLNAMKTHILAEANLMGRYIRRKNNNNN